jgi:acetyltransferase-like isoleucine patch superfamily enzyme/coenzyme F420-reducing hydrogenase beta subunit
MELLDNLMDCCGCKACGDICTQNAIGFHENEKGFWYPSVDKTKCMDCHQCEQICPMLQTSSPKDALAEPVCFAGEHKNLEMLFASSAGGFFSAFANCIYKQGGYVCGAVFTESFEVKHIISGKNTDLSSLRGVKYAQSDMEGIYKAVCSLLETGAKVLYCGTPCQVAALRSFIPKDYDNLLLVDIACNGVSSTLEWRNYLDRLKKEYEGEITYWQGRCKEYGWRKNVEKIILDNKEVHYRHDDQTFWPSDDSIRPSCRACQFDALENGVADISISNFYSIGRYSVSLEKDLGTSIAMIHTHKGLLFFDAAKSKLHYVEVPVSGLKMNGNNELKPNGGFRAKMRRLQGYTKLFFRETRCHPKALWLFFKHNTLHGFLRGDVLIPTPHTIIKVHKGGRILKKGIVIIGHKRLNNSTVETRILVEEGGVLEFQGLTELGYGADVEVFRNANLRIGANFGSNIGATILCQESITIGKDTKLGRNITIMDNNGNHYINRPGYKNCKPVVIGEKVWLCERSTIMPGVHLGDGCIVGALSYVTSSVKSYTMVSGNPAQVVDEDILWKY